MAPSSSPSTWAAEKRARGRPFEHFKVSRLTQDGRAGRGAAISPDGRYVAYFVGDDKGRMGLWVQQVATSSAVQVVPPTEGVICNARFSPDGNYVYYCSYPPTRNSSRLYRVAVLGGVQEPQAMGHRHRTRGSPTAGASACRGGDVGREINS